MGQSAQHGQVRSATPAPMVSWQWVFAKHAQQDAAKLATAGPKPKAQELLAEQHTVKVLRMWSHDE